MFRVLCAIFVLIPSLLFSQEGVQVTLAAVPQSTWILNPQSPDPELSRYNYVPTLGYAGMLTVGVNFVDPVGIQTGFVWSKQGQDAIALTAAGNEVSIRREQTYAKIPLLLRFNSDPDPVIVSFSFGPVLNLLTSADYSVSGDPEFLTPLFPAERQFRKLHWSFMTQLGTDICIGKRSALNLRLLSDYSLGEVEDRSLSIGGESFYASTRGRTRNLCAGVMTGLTWFPVAKKKYYCRAW